MMADAGKFIFFEGTIPTGTPTTGTWWLYFKSDGLYVLDDTATETNIAVPSTVTAERLILNDGSELTISAGVITTTKARHTIDTESDAASDDLDTISGVSDGEMIFVSAADGARTVVLKDGSGNITCATDADITLDDADKRVMLIGTASGVYASPMF